MPAARYWRAVGLQSVGGGALELSALHLYLGGARVDAAATLTSTFAPASGTLAALQDADTATTARWSDVSAPGFALVWDFGAGNAQDVGAVRLGAGALYTEWLETLTLQRSSDGVAWVTLGSIPATSWPGANVLQAAPSDGDVHFSAVSLLLHMDGADGGIMFTDSSSGPKAVTAVGQAKISTAQSKWGGASGYFNGGTSAVKTPYHDAFSFGAGDFTVEAWVWQGAPITQWREIFMINAKDGLNVMLFDGQLAVGRELTNIDLMAPTAISQNAWHHIAVARSAGVCRGFVDGAQVFSGAYAFDFSQVGVVSVGGKSDGSNALSGYIDDLRITKGVARYTANFTPPTAPFPDAPSSGDPVFLPPLLRAPAPERARIAASAPVPPHSTLSAPRLLTARDMEFAGSGTASATGTIYGSTAIKGSPNSPVRAKVSLLRARDLMLVQQTWSDPATGAYAFHGLDPFEKYTTLAEYPTGDYRAVAADQLTPDIEEARAP